MLGISAIVQAFERYEIENIGWIRSRGNVGDAFTNSSPFPTLFSYVRLGVLPKDIAQ